MSAEGQLYNAALFAPVSPTLPVFDTGLHIPSTDLALEYLTIVKDLKTKTPLSVVKGHLFKLMRPALGCEKDLREKLAKEMGALDAYLEIVIRK